MGVAPTCEDTYAFLALGHTLRIYHTTASSPHTTTCAWHTTAHALLPHHTTAAPLPGGQCVVGFHFTGTWQTCAWTCRSEQRKIY